MFQAKEKELGNQNIYAQRGRISSKRSNFRAGQSTQSNPNLNLSTSSFVSNTTPAALQKKEETPVQSVSNLRCIFIFEFRSILLLFQSTILGLSLGPLIKILKRICTLVLYFQFHTKTRNRAGPVE